MGGAGALDGVSVLNVMLGAKPGGLEAMALNAHRALQTQGARLLSVGAPGGWFAKACQEEGDAFAGLSSFGPLDPSASWRLSRQVRGAAPDMVLAHGSRAVALAVRAFGGRVPIAAVVHNFRAKADLARVELAICVSAAVARDVGGRFPGLATVVVENFARLTAPPPRPPLAERLLAGPPRLGSVGRLHRNKGYGVLLSAAALLRDRGVDFQLTIVGDGPERAPLQMEAEVLRLNDRVSFPGWASDPAAALATMDLFVLSSLVEPFGLVVIEAMAAGVPVIASDIDGPRDILDRGRLGALVPPDQPQALVDAIVAALSDPAAVQAMADKAQAEALKRYSLAAGGARLAAALLKIRR